MSYRVLLCVPGCQEALHVHPVTQTPWDGGHYYGHLRVEEAEAQQECILLKVTGLLGGRGLHTFTGSMWQMSLDKSLTLWGP